MEKKNTAEKRAEYHKKARQMGKKEFTLLKMQEYGFWPKDLPTPYERQESESPDDYQIRRSLQKEYDKIASQIARLYKDRQEIQAKLKELVKEFDRTWDAEKIRKAVSQEIFQESIRRREERKKTREEEKQFRVKIWEKQKAENIVYIGKGYSGALGHRETDTAKLIQLNLPVIRDDKELADFLGISFRQLRFLVYHRDVVSIDHYHRYTVAKRKGGQRNIAAPKPLLKQVQKRILEEILEKVEISSNAHGFVKGKSVLTGARKHIESAAPGLLINMDLEDFFPTITFRRVRGLYQSFGYSGFIASLLAMLCTYCERISVEIKGQVKYAAATERILPQGSPASPMITNILCRHMDKEIQETAFLNRFTYSRYADDMSLTFDYQPENRKVREIVYRITKIIENEGFRINEKKTRYLKKNARQIVTGVVINCTEAGVPREWIRRLRAAIHNAMVKQNTGEKIPPAVINEISGMTAWLKSVNASRYRKIIEQAAHLIQSEKS